MEKRNSPVWEVRLGSIRCSVFLNRHGEKEYFNCALTRRYRQGSEFMTSTTFNGLADMAQVKQAVELAIEWLAANETASGASEE